MIPNNCPKCSGYLMPEFFYDDQTGQPLPMIYCLNCGLRADQDIEANRANPVTPPDGRALPRMVGSSRYCVSAEGSSAKNKPGPKPGYKQTPEHIANSRECPIMMHGRAS